MHFKRGLNDATKTTWCCTLLSRGTTNFSIGGLFFRIFFTGLSRRSNMSSWAPTSKSDGTTENWLMSFSKYAKQSCNHWWNNISNTLSAHSINQWIESMNRVNQWLNEWIQGPDFQKILSQTYDKILVKITLRHSWVILTIWHNWSKNVTIILS